MQWKSLEAYDYFGHVRQVLFQLHLILDCPSQSSDKAHYAWVWARQDGEILAYDIILVTMPWFVG